MGDFAGKDNLEERLRAHVEYLAGTLGERNPFWYANLEKARRYIERMFVDAGYDIQHDAYEVTGRTYYNVIAEVPGTNRADELLLVGAHYDTAAGRDWLDLARVRSVTMRIGRSDVSMSCSDSGPGS